MEQTTFTQKMQRLEAIVTALESPNVELEQGLKLLEEGITLHKDCQAILTQSQAKITTLLKADGSSSTSPSEPEASANQDQLPF